MKALLMCFQIVAFLNAAMASNILMVLPLGSISHKNIFVPLAHKLASKGHDVTLFSMYGSSNKSLPYNDIAATTMLNYATKITGDFNVFDMIKKSGSKNVNSEVMKKVLKHLPDYCESFLNDPAGKQVWEMKPDLILLPAFMNECGLIYVHKFNVPFIYVTTSGLTPWTADLVGNPEHPAYVPNQYLPYNDEMTLFERTVNSVMRVAAPVLRNYFIMDRLNNVAQKFLKNSSVELQEVEKRVSLVFVNSHLSLGFPRPLQPNVIEVGGMHCHEAGPIVDEELNSFLNASKDNSVILFSLGSHIKSAQIPISLRNMLIGVFSKIPYKIIWKWEGAPIENLPGNILLKQWLPQQDLLGHRAVGGFISHGGLLSTQEAIYHGVPVVGIPLMSDQFLNIKQAETIGVAISLKIDTITGEQLESAIMSIMQDRSYRDNVQQRSIILKDQETKPVDRAAYYTEYILRHKGAEHMKSKASSLSLVQYFLLDVLLVLVICSLFCLVLIYLLLLIVGKLLKKLAKVTVFFVLNFVKDQIKED